MVSSQETKSAQLYKRAQQVLPGGCSRNTILRKPHPAYVERGEGCYLYDIDGHRYIDFANNMAALIHGHAHPDIVAAVSDQLQRGSAYTMATEVEIEFAEHMCARNAGFDLIRFVNSGTEAVMSSLKAARAYTGRGRIAKVEGAYHGLYDYAEVSQTAKPDNWGSVSRPESVPVAHGTPNSALKEVVVIPFNDVERALEILSREAADLACILVDPLPHRVGLVEASSPYIEALSQWPRDNGVLLVFDEVITYRNQYGGAQEKDSVRPDLTAMGKMIGGGFPVGALAGRREVMEVMNPLADKVLFPHSGTFSANPMTMTAGRVSMELYDQAAVKKLTRLSAYTRDCISQAIQVSGVPACNTGGGSMFRVQLKHEAPQNYREAFTTPAEKKATAMLLDHLFDNGFILMNTCSGALSTAMTQKHVDMLAETLLEGFRKIRTILRDNGE